MLNEMLGRVAYEAAAVATGCTQSWDDANKAKWIAAALAVAETERESCACFCDAKAKTLGERANQCEDAEDSIELRALAWQMTVLAAELRKCPNSVMSHQPQD